MPTADLLDFDSLIAPIPGDNPAGSNLDYELRRKLDEYRTEFDPAQYGEGSPEREQPKREANWGGVIEQTKSMLSKKSKHILYAARLTEALTMVHSFGGVRDGIKLLRRMFAECWDRMMPPIEEPGDEAARVAQINWLGDPTSGAFYPTKIRKLAMFSSGGTALSWQSWKDGQGDFESAADAAPTERCQLLVDDITAAIEELRSFDTVAQEKVPTEGPELGEVSRSLNDCLVLARQALARKQGMDTGLPMGEEGAPGAAPGATGGAATVANRESVYREIDRLAGLLERLEPHSPVPMLLRRAIRLGPLKFHELVAELTKDEKVIDFLKAPAEE
ncbi:MAG: ImpA family type VI secretion system protein [Gemmataceae bacterium]